MNEKKSLLISWSMVVLLLLALIFQGFGGRKAPSQPPSELVLMSEQIGQNEGMRQYRSKDPLTGELIYVTVGPWSAYQTTYRDSNGNVLISITVRKPKQDTKP